MWKQAQSLFAEQQVEEGEDDDLQDNLLEETDGLCSLSPTQVLLFILFCSKSFVNKP